MEVYIDTPVRTARTAAPATREHRTVERAATIPRVKLPSRSLTVLSFVLVDVIALLCSASFSFSMAELLWPGLMGRHLLIALPVLAMQGVIFAASGLYTSTAMHPAEEMRRVAVLVSLVFLVYTAAYFGGYHEWMMVGLLVVMWSNALFLTICGRVFLRIFFAPISWWGYPVVVVGNGEMSDMAIRTMKRWPEMGFKPIVLLDPSNEAEEIDGVPVCQDYGLAPRLARELKIPCAVVAVSGLALCKRHAMLSRYAKFFDRLLVIPETAGTDFLWTTSGFFQGMHGYDVQHNYNKRIARSCKRGMDVLGALVGILLLAPLWAAIMVLIKLDSQGPIFYRQLRMGEKGRVFDVLKFRSMHVDADRKLHVLLEEDPEMRREYEAYRKLREDPRVTRVGNVLRRFSLDELPQLWNVLWGHMSLVGPRAYTLNELDVMNHMESVIIQSRPGLTGLWQVSGRNQLSFEERVSLDVHYTHNWNFWLDAYILARTVPVVLTGKGAC